MTSISHAMPFRGHIKATLVLGLPIIGSHLAQAAISLTDTLMVGRYGVDELAAVTLATTLFFVIFIVGSGPAFAVMPLAAAAEGAGDVRQVRRAVRMGLWISVIYCALLMPVLWNFEALLLRIGQRPEIASLAQEYMRIMQWAMFPALMIMVQKSFLAALERPGWILWSTLAGVIVNALLNYALIYGNWGAPELGVRGAAIASVATAFVTFAVLVAYTRLEVAVKSYEIFVRIWRPDWQAFREVLRLGWPIGATMLAETGLFSATAVMMGWLGTTELATHGIALQIASIAFMVYLGLSNVATIRTGRALGRNDLTGIWRAALAPTVLQLAFALIMTMLFLVIPGVLIGLFLDLAHPKAAEIVAYGAVLMIAAAAFQIVDGLQVVALSALRGIKDTTVPMVCAVLSYWVIGMPASYYLAFVLGYGGIGIWTGLVIGLAFAAGTLIWRFLYLMKRMGGVRRG
ncbi:MAG: MATE family efflux transporter [Proteobacteria bacterium]|nr:MATE family efflux transporter [Pseudomonadota bacterium]